MDKNLAYQNKMLNTPIQKLIIILAIPTIVSMLISNIYNLVDTFFIGTLGVSQSGAVGVIFTLLTIIQAFAFMLGHGSGSYIARFLAASKKDVAESYFNTAFFSGLTVGVIFMIIGISFLTPLCYLLGSSETILPYAKSYAFYIILGSPFLITSLIMNNVLRYQGKALYATIGLSLGGILNMAMDPLFIFGLNLGIGGAGLATFVSQVISFITLTILFKKHSIINFNWKAISSSFQTYWKIIMCGLPSLFRQGLASFSSGLLNNICRPYGDSCVAGMSIVSRLLGFMIAVEIGIGQGFQPVSSFSYQVKRYDRLKKAFYFTMTLCFCSMFIFSGFGLIFSKQLVQLFALNKDADVAQVIAIGQKAMKYMCIGLLVSPLSLLPNMLFQSTGQNASATLLASFRSGLFYIPVLLLFSRLLGVNGIQMSQPVADTISGLVSIPFFITFFKKIEANKLINDCDNISS